MSACVVLRRDAWLTLPVSSAVCVRLGGCKRSEGLAAAAERSIVSESKEVALVNMDALIVLLMPRALVVLRESMLESTSRDSLQAVRSASTLLSIRLRVKVVCGHDSSSACVAFLLPLSTWLADSGRGLASNPPKLPLNLEMSLDAFVITPSSITPAFVEAGDRGRRG